MRSFPLGLIMIVLFASPCFAQVEAVKLLASQSDLVVIATFTKTVFAVGSGRAWYREDFDVVTVLAGKTDSKSLSVDFTLPNSAPAPALKTGQKVILFLKRRPVSPPDWTLTDRFLGCQDADRGLQAVVSGDISD